MLQVSGIEPVATDAAWQLPATERSAPVLAEKHSLIDGLGVPKLPLDAQKRSAAIFFAKTDFTENQEGIRTRDVQLGKLTARQRKWY